MARGLKRVALLLFLLLLSSLFFSIEARPIRDSEPQSMIEGEIIEELYVEAIKTGGPSHGGDGHAATHALIHKSGPSPGAGN